MEDSQLVPMIESARPWKMISRRRFMKLPAGKRNLSVFGLHSILSGCDKKDSPNTLGGTKTSGCWRKMTTASVRLTGRSRTHYLVGRRKGVD